MASAMAVAMDAGHNYIKTLNIINGGTLFLCKAVAAATVVAAAAAAATLSHGRSCGLSRGCGCG